MSDSSKRLNALYTKPRPLVFGHRGAMAYTPMNTLPAFELAAEQGADGIELDVWLSNDDELIVIHDETLDATTDGEGKVSWHSVSELKELDAGSWFDEKFRGAQIPTLDEVFEALGNRLYINVEIKHIAFDARLIVSKTVECVRRHHLEDRVLISSFNPFVIRNIARTAPDIPRAVLQSPEVPRFLALVLWGVPLDALHPYHEQVDDAYIQRARSQGRRVNVWTVNDAAAAVRLQQLGVDALITDNPDVILAAIQDAET